MMNILYFVPNPPSLVRVRPYNLIAHLQKRGHRVTVATTWANPSERDDIERLRAQGLHVIAARLTKPRIGLNLANALASGQPLQAAYCWQPDLAARLSAIASQFDVVHVEHLRGARYGRAIKSRTPVIWDSVDCITYLFEQAAKQSQSAFGKLVTRLELGRTRRHEGWLARQFEHVIITSEIDKAELEKLGRRPDAASPACISVIPNGVDLHYFTPADETRQPGALIFSGKMSYHANVTAALHLINDIMPLVWRERPDAQAWIVGKDPSRAIRQAAERHAPRVTVTGTVPDMRVYLRRAAIALVPLVYGAGSQFKVMEAAACETPVIASRQAVTALQAVEGEQLLVADDAATFARYIVQLLADEKQQRRLGVAGRQYVERHHNWETIAAQLESIYARSIENARAKNR